jgi:hypothetical protein
VKYRVSSTLRLYIKVNRKFENNCYNSIKFTGLVNVPQQSYTLESKKKPGKFANVWDACSKKYYNLEKSLLIKSCCLRCKLTLLKSHLRNIKWFGLCNTNKYPLQKNRSGKICPCLADMPKKVLQFIKKTS